MAEAALINDPELRAEQQRLIQEQYNELMMQAENDYQVAKYDLQESFFLDWVDLNEMTLDQFQNLTDEEMDIIMTDMVPVWKNGISEMADAFAGEGGFAEVTREAWNQIQDAENEYADDVETLETISDQTFDTITNGQDETITKGQALLEQNDELIDTYGKELQAVQNVYDEVLKLRDAYKEAESAAIAAAKAAYELYEAEKLRLQTLSTATETYGISFDSNGNIISTNNGDTSNDNNSGGGGSDQKNKKTQTDSKDTTDKTPTESERSYYNITVYDGYKNSSTMYSKRSKIYFSDYNS
jgi:hypothetical protein